MGNPPPIPVGAPLPGFSLGRSAPTGAEPDGRYDFGDGPVAARRHPRGGGWVADTVDMDRNALVEAGSLVFGRARVRGPVRIAGRSLVFGDAWVWGSARIENGSQVCEHAMVSEDAWIDGGSVVKGRAWITGRAYLGGSSVALDDVLVAQDARVDEQSEVAGRAQIYGAAELRKGARASGEETLYGDQKRYGRRGGQGSLC